MLYSAILVSVLATGSLCAPAGYILHEKRDSPNTALARRSRLDGEHIIPVRIGLTQSNLDKGYDKLMDIAHPDSPAYGTHWTKEQVDAFFAPSEESIHSVKNWLAASGVDIEKITNVEKGWLAFNLPAKQAEALFQTEYYEHEAENGNVRIGCDEYHLPEQVSAHVDYIKPGIALSPPLQKRTIEKRGNGPAFAQRFGNLAKPFIAPPTLSTKPFQTTTESHHDVAAEDFKKDDSLNCSEGITAACYQALYNIPVAGAADNVNSLGIYEAGGSYSQDDLNSYYSQYATNVPSGTGPENLDINGATSPSDQDDANFEADIDFEIAYGLIYPEQTILYQDGTPGIDNDANQTFLTGFLDYVDGSFCTSQEESAGYQCGAGNLTNVISISYTSTELAVPQAAQVRSCNEIMKLTMQGTTFVIASGDYGVASQPNATADYNGCYDPRNANSGTGKVFSPTFPNNCPYVLSVGATQLASSGSTSDPEVAMLVDSDSTPNQDIYFSSSGGFANYFSLPSYQNSAVSNYFANYDPGYTYYTYNGQDLYTSDSNIGTNGGVYNRAGRGFPDVSANGVNFESVYEGQDVYAVGTSLATPVWASIITMINQNRTAQGKSSVGFINPTLYANPSALNDITSGSNPGCESNGFSAVAGWDPVTGLGTPNFPALLSIFANLQ